MVVLGKKNSNGIKSIPKVNFNSEVSKNVMSKMCTTKFTINEYVGLLLLRLGFKVEDEIMISYCGDNTFSCLVNDMELYNIHFDGKEKILLSRFNIEYGYDCVSDGVSEIGFMINMSKAVVKHPDGMVYTRLMSKEYAKFVVEKNGFLLELALNKPKDLDLPIYTDGRPTKYELNNEDELFKYLGSLSEDDSLVLIYKELCNNYLEDIAKYPDFVLRLSKLNEKNEYYSYGLIMLKNGEFEQAIMTTDEGYIVFVDKFDNWKVKMISSLAEDVNFMLESNNGILSCNFDCIGNRNLFDYVSRPIKVDVENANYRANAVKYKVKRLFCDK